VFPIKSHLGGVFTPADLFKTKLAGTVARRPHNRFLPRELSLTLSLSLGVSGKKERIEKERKSKFHVQSAYTLLSNRMIAIDDSHFGTRSRYFRYRARASASQRRPYTLARVNGERGSPRPIKIFMGTSGVRYGRRSLSLSLSLSGLCSGRP